MLWDQPKRFHATSPHVADQLARSPPGYDARMVDRLLVPHLTEHATSIFGNTSRRAAQLGAVNLGQGFPDTDGLDIIKEAARDAIRDGLGNQYPPLHGVPELREAIARHQDRFYGLDVSAAEGVVVTGGASEAIASTMLALVDDGDEVLMFDPRFDLYAAAISMARGKRVSVPMTNTRPDLAALEAAITPRSRMLVVNSPHNPTGVVFTRDELLAIAQIAITHNLIVVADEVYEHLWFDEHEHIPISTLPGMFERTVTLGSGGKSFSFTGWRIGWASGPAGLIEAVRSARQHMSYVSAGPLQWAMVTALDLPDAYYEEIRLDLQAKRDVLTRGLTDIGFGVIPSEGTYFLMTDIAPLGFDDAVEFCHMLPEEYGVAAIPMPFLSDDPAAKTMVRWAFCKQPHVLEEALTRLSPLR